MAKLIEKEFDIISGAVLGDTCADNEEISTNHNSNMCVQISEDRAEYLSPSVAADCTFYDITCNEVLVVMPLSSLFHFHGSVKVSVIAGTAEVNGFKIIPNMPPLPVSSLTGTSALYIMPLEGPSEMIDVSLIVNLGLHLMEATKVCNFVNRGGCLLLLEKTNINFNGSEDSNVKKGSQLSRCERLLDILIYNSNNRISNKLKFHESMSFDIISNSKIILCGGKNVGKSTSLRYLVNKALNCFPQVIYIDLDVGQPEFTLSECVSAVLIDKPLLGPGYSHFKKPFISYYLGDNNVINCIDTYQIALKKLIEFCKNDSTFRNTPFFFNTMGFNKGIGVQIISNIIDQVEPTVVIQIEGKGHQNFPSYLTHSYVSSVISKPVNEYELLIVPAFNKKSNNSIKYSNVEMRWLSIQSYFNQDICTSSPLICPLEKIKVVNAKTKEVINPNLFEFLNMKIIALSSSAPDEEIHTIIDFGVILSFDKNNQVFIILTPHKTSDDIKILLLGSLQIPCKINKVIDKSSTGLVPYIQVGLPSEPLIKPVKRKHRFLFGV